MSTQPEALRLAERLERYDAERSGYAKHCHAAAAELRRLHKSNQELIKALQACAYAIQNEIWNSGEDEDENPNTKGQVLLVKKARAAIAKAEGDTP